MARNTITAHGTCLLPPCPAAACRDLVEDYKQKKDAGVFEVRRPKTTKEITIHNNQLLQELPGQIHQAIAAITRGEEPATAWWSEAQKPQPNAPPGLRYRSRRSWSSSRPSSFCAGQKSLNTVVQVCGLSTTLLAYDTRIR